jgi:RHS repeat-associated protein
VEVIMAMGKYINLKTLTVTFLFLLISILTVSHEVYPRNWDWDQNHDCVQGEDGSGTWGRYDYEGVFLGGYTTKECCEYWCKICPIYANTGRYQKTFTDLIVPGVGPALIITRTYNSQEWASSLLGYSWAFNFGRKLIITRNKDGEKIIGVILNTGEKNYYREDIDGTLTRLTDYGTSYDLIKNNNSTYSIKSNDGTWYELRDDGKIAKIIDKNQNELVFTYNSVSCINRITNASGNYVDFQLGVNGKIASVSDNLGRTVVYGYDDNGNLTAVTDPLGNTTQYVYNSYNLLTQFIDARGNVVETVAYDNHEPPRVSSFTEKGETYTIAYFDGRTEKTDSHGNKWTSYYNDVGVIFRVVDPLGNEKTQNLNKVTATSADWKEDGNNNRRLYVYDENGNISAETDPAGNTWNYTYVSGTNWLKTETDPLGVVRENVYDENGNRKEVIQDFGGPLQSSTKYTYDSNGNMISMIDPLGNTISLEYSSIGKVTRRTDALGNTTAYTYDVRGNLVSETDAAGNKKEYVYNLMNQIVSVTDALGNVTVYSYDANGNTSSKTDANGEIWRFTYDEFNRRIGEKDPLGNTTLCQYNSEDKLISKTDPNGNTTLYNYDTAGHLIAEVDALGNQTSYIYDAAGNKLSETDANGNRVLFEYDSNNRIISKNSPSGLVTRYEYDAIGNMIAEHLPYGSIITKTYDRLRRVVAIQDSIGQIKSYSYDILGNVVTTTDGCGNTTQFVYDANNRLVQEIDTLGNSTVYSYNSVGNLISVRDRNDNMTTYSYDSAGKVISQTDHLGHTTTISYDNAGNIVTITDALGHKTIYTYDAARRLTRETYADGTSKTFSYASNGNLTSRLDQNGTNTIYRYDNLNRRTMVDYPGTNDNIYTYDSVSNLINVNNAIITIEFEYDNENRVTESRQNANIVRYSYEPGNNVRTVVYPNGKVVREVRNQRGYLVRVEDGSGQTIVEYNRDVCNREVSKAYSNGIVGAFVYDAIGRRIEMNYEKEGVSVSAFEYGYDQELNPLFKRVLLSPAESEQYIFDQRYRLARFLRGELDSQGLVPNPVSETVFDLDPLSNWTNIIGDGSTQVRVHNEMNEIVQTDGYTFLYDNNGNLIDYGINNYTYDYENRLVEVTRKSDNEILAQYKYDALGRRTEKNSGGLTVSYFYDGDRVIEESINSGQVAVYVYGQGVDEIVMAENTSGLYFYHMDNADNVILVTNAAGDSIESYRYDAYGSFVAQTGSGEIEGESSIGNHYTFSSRRWDSETGLYYYRARYYSPVMGRFIQRDPSGYSDSLNLYEYARSNTLRFIDPYGLWSAPEVLKYLCCYAKDTGSVNALNNAEMYKFNKYCFDWIKYEKKPDGSRGDEIARSTRPFCAGGAVIGNKIYIKESKNGIPLSDKEAAAILYHESIHLRQSNSMSLQEMELEAYSKEEEYGIFYGLPEHTANFRIRYTKRFPTPGGDVYRDAYKPNDSVIAEWLKIKYPWTDPNVITENYGYDIDPVPLLPFQYNWSCSGVLGN